MTQSRFQKKKKSSPRISAEMSLSDTCSLATRCILTTFFFSRELLGTQRGIAEEWQIINYFSIRTSYVDLNFVQNETPKQQNGILQSISRVRSVGAGSFPEQRQLTLSYIQRRANLLSRESRPVSCLSYTKFSKFSLTGLPKKSTKNSRTLPRTLQKLCHAIKYITLFHKVSARRQPHANSIPWDVITTTFTRVITEKVLTIGGEVYFYCRCITRSGWVDARLFTLANKITVRIVTKKIMPAGSWRLEAKEAEYGDPLEPLK